MTGPRAVNIPWEHPAWQHAAACRNLEGVNFFPEQGESATPAKRICGMCPVIADCRAYIQAHPQPGVWAGTSEYDRRKPDVRVGAALDAKRERERLRRRAALGLDRASKAAT